MLTTSPDTRRTGGTLLELLHPHGQLWLFVGLFVVGLVVAWLGVLLFALPRWAGALLRPSVRVAATKRNVTGGGAPALSPGT